MIIRGSLIIADHRVETRWNEQAHAQRPIHYGNAALRPDDGTATEVAVMMVDVATGARCTTARARRPARLPASLLPEGREGDRHPLDAGGRGRPPLPGTEGIRPLGADLINWYVGKVHRAATHDPEVYRAFLKVMNLMRAPSTLFEPRMMLP